MIQSIRVNPAVSEFFQTFVLKYTEWSRFPAISTNLTIPSHDECVQQVSCHLLKMWYIPYNDYTFNICWFKIPTPELELICPWFYTTLTIHFSHRQPQATIKVLFNHNNIPLHLNKSQTETHNWLALWTREKGKREKSDDPYHVLFHIHLGFCFLFLPWARFSSNPNIAPPCSN